MTIRSVPVVVESASLAVLGARPRFPSGLPLAPPSIPDVSRVSRRLAQVLASGRLTNGENVRALEERVADLCGVRHAVAVSSCTAGLMLVYRCLEVRGPVALKPFEAMAMGVPVIASDLPALAEPLTRSRGGLLVAAESEQALAAAILQLAGDALARERLGANARAHLTAQHDPAVAADAIRSALLPLLGESDRWEEGRPVSDDRGNETPRAGAPTHKSGDVSGDGARTARGGRGSR